MASRNGECFVGKVGEGSFKSLRIILPDENVLAVDNEMGNDSVLKSTQISHSLKIVLKPIPTRWC